MPIENVLRRGGEEVGPLERLSMATHPLSGMQLRGARAEGPPCCRLDFFFAEGLSEVLVPPIKMEETVSNNLSCCLGDFEALYFLERPSMQHELSQLQHFRYICGTYALITSCLSQGNRARHYDLLARNLKLDNPKLDHDIRVFFSTLDKQCVSDATLDWNGWNSVAHFSFGNSVFE